MAGGTVKFFNTEKNSGFIVPDDESSDVFVHGSDVTGPQLQAGERGRRFGYDGLSRALRRRAHEPASRDSTRTSFATRPPIAGSRRAARNPGLMAMVGWTRTDMLVRYTKARASQRAAEEARRLNLGDL